MFDAGAMPTPLIIDHDAATVDVVPTTPTAVCGDRRI
jgi:hypothetical protein